MIEHNFNKKNIRIHRAMKIRKKIKEIKAIRFLVHRTIRHIYAQIIDSNGSKILVSASTIEKNISQSLNITSNKNAAVAVGRVLAERALNKNIKKVSFDRSGFKYHGRIQALANSAREHGLQF